MNESSPQSKTSGASRRRQYNHRQGHRASANKAYLSESDMPGAAATASYDGNYNYGDETDGPQTPQKKPFGSPAYAPNGPASGPRLRSNNKARPKNVHVSPESTKVDRNTPPLTTSGAKPPPSAAAAAFAGSTFHASPAPSALPIPGFMAKVSSESPRPSSANNQSLPLSPGHEASPQPSNTGPPTPQRQLPEPGARDSPLEALFQAHRAEKERTRRSSSAHASAPGPGATFTPPIQVSPDTNFFRSPISHSTGLRPGQRAGGISADELDGTPGQPYGPAFSTPYHERIRASRTSSSQASEASTPRGTSTPTQAPFPEQPAPPQDRVEALKEALWGPKKVSPAAPQPTAVSAPAPGPTPGYSAPPAPPAPPKESLQAEGPRPANIAAMENSLRRILNIRN